MTAPWPVETGLPLAPARAVPTLKSMAWFVALFQMVLTWFSLCAVATASVVVGGVLTEPLEGVFIAVFSAVATVVPFGIGLPLRLVPRLRAWWFRHASWTIVLFVLAVAGVVASYFVGGAGSVHYVATADWPASDGHSPDPAVFSSSLAVLAFASMHVLLPLRRWKGLA